MATPTPDPSPLAQRALRRQNPREEPSALTRTLGSVRGAPGNGRPYRDPPASALGGRRQTTLVLRWLKTVVASVWGKGALDRVRWGPGRRSRSVWSGPVLGADVVV